MRFRQKACAHCLQPTEVLFRVRPSSANDWRFVCKACLPALKHQNPDYQYGGTWKAQKPR